MTNLTKNILDTGKKILISVGRNNKPIYAVMAVAVANGIFKPITSLTDKKEKPEARKYAALREFLTEVVAVPTYWACGVGAAKLGESLFKNNPEKKAVARANMMFLGVCTAAVFIIPAACSLLIKALNLSGKKDSRAKTPKLDVTVKAPDIKISQKQDMKIEFQNLLRPSMESFTHRGGLKI